MTKFIKVMFGNKGANFEYKIGEVNSTTIWNPKAEKGRDFGGFNYCREECIIRWLHRGDTVYDVEVPTDAENIKIDGATEIYRCNKIILTNPKKIDDELALHFYQISDIPEKSYYKALGAVSIMNYHNTALTILRDKVNQNNIDEVLKEWNDFIFCGGKYDRSNGLVNEISDYLKEIKSSLLVSINVSKKPYIKKLSNDKIINLTGQSGAGKTTYAKNEFNTDDYLIVDTDDIFSDKRFEHSKEINKNLGTYFRNKYKKLPSLSDDFDLIYNDILDYFKNTDKTIVIDCAQFHCCKDINILKGKFIMLRTSIDECYKRVLNRWINNYEKNGCSYTDEDFNNYKMRKAAIYKWYKGTNKFLEKIDKL